MKSFIQLHDGIGFAIIHTEGDVDHTVTPDHITAVEVDSDNPSQFLKMKYDEKTKSWSQAPLIYYGEVDDRGNVIEIRRTYFVHETEGMPILPEDFEPNWKWINNEWVKPYIESEVIVSELTAPTETEEERIARVTALGGTPN